MIILYIKILFSSRALKYVNPFFGGKNKNNSVYVMNHFTTYNTQCQKKHRILLVLQLISYQHHFSLGTLAHSRSLSLTRCGPRRPYMMSPSYPPLTPHPLPTISPLLLTPMVGFEVSICPYKQGTWSRWSYSTYRGGDFEIEKKNLS